MPAIGNRVFTRRPNTASSTPTRDGPQPAGVGQQLRAVGARRTGSPSRCASTCAQAAGRQHRAVRGELPPHEAAVTGSRGARAFARRCASARGRAARARRRAPSSTAAGSSGSPRSPTAATSAASRRRTRAHVRGRRCVRRWLAAVDFARTAAATPMRSSSVHVYQALQPPPRAARRVERSRSLRGSRSRPRRRRRAEAVGCPAGGRSRRRAARRRVVSGRAGSRFEQWTFTSRPTTR